MGHSSTTRIQHSSSSLFIPDNVRAKLGDEYRLTNRECHSAIQYHLSTLDEDTIGLIVTAWRDNGCPDISSIPLRHTELVPGQTIAFRHGTAKVTN